MKRNNAVLTGIIIFLIFSSAHAYAKDDIGLRAYADRGSITIGDRIKFTIEVTYPRGTEIQMPAFKDSLIGEFEIKDSGNKSFGRLFGGKRLRSWYFITTYSVGKKEIPPLDIKFKPKGAGDWDAKKTAAIPISVMSVLPKDLPADIRDINGPAHFFEINWFLVGVILSFIAALIAAFIIYLRIRARKPIRLPHETALEELEAIRSQLINSGDAKEYFVGVSDCVRRYIERVFSLKAPEMTTEEFLNSMHDSAALTIQHKELLKGFMNACDMVKFAKYMPTGEERDSLYETARNFIYETKGPK